jgi:hypothetical protein
LKVVPRKSELTQAVGGHGDRNEGVVAAEDDVRDRHQREQRGHGRGVGGPGGVVIELAELARESVGCQRSEIRPPLEEPTDATRDRGNRPPAWLKMKRIDGSRRNALVSSRFVMARVVSVGTSRKNSATLGKTQLQARAVG